MSSSPAIVTAVKMLESLPEAAQEQVVSHLREYIADLEDELRWDRAFEKTATKVTAAARTARIEISQGKAEPLDLDAL